MRLLHIVVWVECGLFSCLSIYHYQLLAQRDCAPVLCCRYPHQPQADETAAYLNQMRVSIRPVSLFSRSLSLALSRSLCEPGKIGYLGSLIKYSHFLFTLAECKL